MGSRSIDDEEQRDPVSAWRALRPDQRGAVYDGLAQLADRVRADMMRRASTIEACPDLEATYLDTGEAIGCAVRALRHETKREDADRVDVAVSRLVVAIDALPPEVVADVSTWLRSNEPCPLPRSVRRALADLVEAEAV